MRSAARECDQVGDIAGRQRQFQNPLGLDHLTYGRAPRLHERSIGLNLDLLGNLTDVENGVYHLAAIHLQDNAGLDECAKTG